MDNTNQSILYEQLASPSADPFSVVLLDSALESTASGEVDVEYEGPLPYPQALPFKSAS